MSRAAKAATSLTRCPDRKSTSYSWGSGAWVRLRTRASVGRWESGEGSLNIFLASDGDHADHHAFVRDYGIDPDRYVVSRELGLQFMVDKLPFAVLIDEGGVLRARGLVNSREHLESLFEARRRGVGTLQEHFQKEGLWHEVA